MKTACPYHFSFFRSRCLNRQTHKQTNKHPYFINIYRLGLRPSIETLRASPEVSHPDGQSPSCEDPAIRYIHNDLLPSKVLSFLVHGDQNRQKSYFSSCHLTSSSIFRHKEWRYEKSDDNHCKRAWTDLFEYPKRFSVSLVVHEIFEFKNRHFYRFLPIFWPFLAIFW